MKCSLLASLLLPAHKTSYFFLSLFLSFSQSTGSLGPHRALPAGGAGEPWACGGRSGSQGRACAGGARLGAKGPRAHAIARSHAHKEEGAGGHSCACSGAHLDGLGRCGVSARGQGEGEHACAPGRHIPKVCIHAVVHLIAGHCASAISHARGGALPLAMGLGPGSPGSQLLKGPSG